MVLTEGECLGFVVSMAFTILFGGRLWEEREHRRRTAAQRVVDPPIEEQKKRFETAWKVFD